MGNSGDPRFLTQLNAWAESPPTAASNRSEASGDPVLRELAKWARALILGPR
jgi:hypothetical protein